MTDEQMSLLIAESLEPRSDFENNPTLKRSDLRYWSCPYRFDGKAEFIPRDFVSDPRMTLMLMKLEGFVEVCRISTDGGFDHPDDGYVAEFCGRETHSPAGCTDKFGQATDKDLGRAVALAYIKAKSLAPSPTSGKGE